MSVRAIYKEGLEGMLRRFVMRLANGAIIKGSMTLPAYEVPKYYTRVCARCGAPNECEDPETCLIGNAMVWPD